MKFNISEQFKNIMVAGIIPSSVPMRNYREESIHILMSSAGCTREQADELVEVIGSMNRGGVFISIWDLVQLLTYKPAPSTEEIESSMVKLQKIGEGDKQC